MAKEYKYLVGKAKWARLVIPDPEYKKWQLSLYLNAESLEIFKGLGVKTHLKKDDDGYYVKLSRPVDKLFNGKLTAFQPPVVTDAEGKPIEKVLIGNGSDVTCKIEYYGYKDPRGNPGKAIRLESVRVDNLVPFVPLKDTLPEHVQGVKGLIDQPAPNF